MKKFVSFICIMLMLLTMTACGGAAADDGKYYIGICQLVTHDALDAATKGFVDALKEALGEENVEFKEQNAAGENTYL